MGVAYIVAEAPQGGAKPRFRSVAPWAAELRNAAGASAAVCGEQGVFTWRQPEHEWLARHRIEIGSPAGLHALWLESLQDFSSFFSGPFPDWPPEQWNALVEMAIAPVLAAIGRALDSEVRVAHVGMTPLTEIRRHQASAVPRLEFTFRPHGAARDVAGALEINPAQRYLFRPAVPARAAAWAWLGVPLVLRMGALRLSVHELATLHVGAALRMDASARAQRTRAWLCINGRRPMARVELNGDSLHIHEIAHHGSLPMTTPERDATDSPAADGEPDIPLDRLEVELVFESAQLTLPLAELARLRAGSVISMGHRVADHVLTVRANGQIVGRGEFIEVGDELAVRLTQWRPRGGG